MHVGVCVCLCGCSWTRAAVALTDISVLYFANELPAWRTVRLFFGFFLQVSGESVVQRWYLSPFFLRISSRKLVELAGAREERVAMPLNKKDPTTFITRTRARTAFFFSRKIPRHMELPLPPCSWLIFRSSSGPGLKMRSSVPVRS